MDKYIGRLLDNRYEILEVIGTGGMAVVYKARCHRLNRLVAVKILKDDYIGDEDFRSRFHSESQAVAMLSHPNIVSVYDVSTSVMADYIVMELIEGISLKQYMEKKGVLNWKETLHFAMQIGKALEHAHSRGIVHRDIKPHNIMVLKNGSVKVTDFGIARVMSKGNTLTKEALGSVHYISPEQAKGGRVDDRSDIYSLGTVMYEMMTGRPPYDGESPVAVAIQHINGGAAMPSTINPNIPGGLEQIIMKAMAIDPTKRYAGATAMLRDMDEFRKDPAMLFDYNGTGGDVMNVKRGPLILDLHTGSKRTTAERVAQRSGNKNGKPVTATNTTVTKAGSGRSREAARRRREEELRRNRITLIAVITCGIVILAALIVTLVVLLGFMTDMPDVIGMNVDEAQAMYDDVRFNIVDEEYNELHPADDIIWQEHDAGDRIFKREKVDVVISLGPANGGQGSGQEGEQDQQGENEDNPKEVKLTNLVGHDEEVARTLISSYKLNIVVHTKRAFSDTYQKGKVVAMEPGEGATLTEGAEITLTISQGHQPKLMELKGKTEKFATDYLYGLEIGLAVRIVTEYSEDVQKDQIIRTNPKAGTLLDFDQTVELVISAGSEVEMAVLPDVVNVDALTAMKKLVNAGFKNVDYEYTASYLSKDLVVKMSPDSGKEYDVTTKIVLYVSDGSLTAPGSGGKTVTVQVPAVEELTQMGIVLEDGAQTVIVTLKLVDGTTVYTSGEVAPGATVTTEVKGSGKQSYVVYINDKQHQIVEVEFGA